MTEILTQLYFDIIQSTESEKELPAEANAINIAVDVQKKAKAIINETLPKILSLKSFDFKPVHREYPHKKFDDIPSTSSLNAGATEFKHTNYQALCNNFQIILLQAKWESGKKEPLFNCEEFAQRRAARVKAISENFETNLTTLQQLLEGANNMLAQQENKKEQKDTPISRFSNRH